MTTITVPELSKADARREAETYLADVGLAASKNAMFLLAVRLQRIYQEGVSAGVEHVAARLKESNHGTE